MANINNTNNQEAVVSFDPWANHSDAELDAMAEAYAEREGGVDVNLARLEECKICFAGFGWGNTHCRQATSK